MGRYRSSDPLGNALANLGGTFFQGFDRGTAMKMQEAQMQARAKQQAFQNERALNSEGMAKQQLQFQMGQSDQLNDFRRSKLSQEQQAREQAAAAAQQENMAKAAGGSTGLELRGAGQETIGKFKQEKQANIEDEIRKASRIAYARAAAKSRAKATDPETSLKREAGEHAKFVDSMHKIQSALGNMNTTNSAPLLAQYEALLGARRRQLLQEGKSESQVNQLMDFVPPIEEIQKFAEGQGFEPKAIREAPQYDYTRDANGNVVFKPAVK